MKRFLIEISREIMGFFVEYSKDAVWIALAFTVCYIAWLVFYKKKKLNTFRETKEHVFGFFLLVFYLYMVLAITILSRVETPTQQISFELFRTFQDNFWSKKKIYENIIMFVPFSMLIYWITFAFRKWWRMMLLGAGCSLVIEVTQWITMTGCFEVDDILTNTMGMIVGYLISICMIKIRNLIKRWTRNHAMKTV